MKIKYLFCIILIFFIEGCTLIQKPSNIIYSRTKDIRFNGQISTTKGESMLSVTWKYAEQKIVKNNIKSDEELQDCFRSELVYNGISNNTIHFLIKNYLCGTHTPVNIESVTFDQTLPTLITFHSMQLKILSADNSKVIFESQ